VNPKILDAVMKEKNMFAFAADGTLVIQLLTA
jgi:hypothetical protein